MAGKMLTAVSKQNFDEEVLNSDLPVFACFTTSWCRACFPTCLVADELVNRYEGRIKFVRINKEKAPASSIRKCNTWGCKGVTLSVYGETI